MNHTDARAFVQALNAIIPYVPPMHMQALLANPICKAIEQTANDPGQLNVYERPKPQAVP